jgi:hypothetical protein
MSQVSETTVPMSGKGGKPQAVEMSIKVFFFSLLHQFKKIPFNAQRIADSFRENQMVTKAKIVKSDETQL